MSLPAGERGLKFIMNDKIPYTEESLPAGERGLKYLINGSVHGIIKSRSPQGSVD